MAQNIQDLILLGAADDDLNLLSFAAWRLSGEDFVNRAGVTFM